MLNKPFWRRRFRISETERPAWFTGTVVALCLMTLMGVMQGRDIDAAIEQSGLNQNLLAHEQRCAKDLTYNGQIRPDRITADGRVILFCDDLPRREGEAVRGIPYKLVTK